MTVILTTPATWLKFQEDCKFILDETNMPESWLAKLLGYRSAAGLFMALRSQNPSSVVAERASKLRRGLQQHRTQMENRKRATT